VNTYFYDTFGDDSPASSETVLNPFHYTARELDSETGLYFYRARYYDPLFGRFLTEDPTGVGGMNGYAYSENRPTSLVDPAGLASTDPSGDAGVDAVAATLARIRRLLPDDPKCLKFLCSNKISPLSAIDDILNNHLLGLATIQPTRNADGTLSVINAATSIIPGQAISVNRIGAYFSSSYNGLPLSTNNGRISGGTAAAQGFILLHELGHVTNVLENDLNNKRAGERNNNLLQKECKKTIKAVGAK